jgi:hypothetical protein
MEINGETILHPEPAEILGQSPAQAAARLEAEWDAELGWPRLDLERLVGSGQLARYHRVPGVELRLQAWLHWAAPPKSLEIAGLFLLGYWAGAQTADGGLVRLLLKGLQGTSPGDAARDTLIAALGNGHRCTPDRAAAAEVERAFAAIWQAGTYNPKQPLTVAALRRVLNLPA